MTPSRTPSRTRPVGVNPVPLYVGLLLLVLVVVGVGWWIRSDRTPGPSSTGSVLALEPVGVPLSATTVIQDRTVEFVKAYRASGYRTYRAAESKEFIVASFKPISENAGALLASVERWYLAVGTERVALTGVDLPTAGSTTSNGAVYFEVPTGATELRLVLSEDESIPLDLPVESQ